MNLKDLRVNGNRLQGSLEEMAKIGATPGGGVQRLTLTDEDKQARDLYISWLEELNLEITIDEMGNIFGKRAGTNNDLPPVMSGSHIEQCRNRAPHCYCRLDQRGGFTFCAGHGGFRCVGRSPGTGLGI